MRRREFLASVGGAAAAIGHRASAAGPAEPFCFCVAADSHCNDAPGKGMEGLGTGADREMHLGRNDSCWFNDLVRRTRPEAVFFGHLHQPTASSRLGDTAVWQVCSCCWSFDGAPIGFLHVRVGPSALAVREIIMGAPQKTTPGAAVPWRPVRRRLSYRVAVEQSPAQS